MNKDLYEILEVDKSSSIEDIKKSYKKLAIKYHPDRNSGSKESEEKFKEISNAYTILSDPDKKNQYDRYGTVDENSNRSNPFDGFSGFEDIFGDIFGNRNRKSGPQKRRGSDLRVKVTVTIKDILFGTSKKIKYTRNTQCNTCNGKGGEDIIDCVTCSGNGYRSYVQNTPFGTIKQSAVCNSCNGNGKSIKTPCKSCSGQGCTISQETVDIDIPKGAIHGNYFTMPSYGNYVRDGIYGDLQIVIEEIQDPLFKREDLNIVYDDNISVIDAILGTQRKIKTPDDKEFTYNILPGTKHGKLFKISGKGIPDIHYNGYAGDMIIRVNINIPSYISNEEREVLEKLKESKNFK